MEEKELKTSLKQRIIIGAIAIIMVGSMIASYAAIVLNGSSSSSSSDIGAERMAYYQSNYDEKLEAIKEVTVDDFKKFSPYLNNIVEYDEATANEGDVSSRDILKGDGRKLTEGDTDYLAYYVGWCANAEVFDSSLDDVNTPTSFAKVLNASVGMIDGWNTAVIGMRLGGIRELTIPGEKAYGDQMEICGGYNKPLKFLVMAVENKEPLKTAAAELDNAFMMLQYANYGIDYEEEMKASAEEESASETTEDEAPVDSEEQK